MTTIFDQSQAGRPHTHVFIAGVGKYPHLAGGDGEPMDDDFGLGQLSSPPISARAFGRWVLESFRNPKASLGTVELLLSEESDDGGPVEFELPGGEGVAVEAATIDNLEAAGRRWLDRCNQHRDNIAIFYHCGHGLLVGGDQLLLAEDFGADHLQEFANSINFDAMYRGMTGIKAQLQCFFVDACSNIPFDALDVSETGARSLVTGRRRRPYQREAPVLKAAAPDSRAYGEVGDVSRFTTALIRSLDGLGAEPDENNPEQWVVTTSRLIDAVYRVVIWLNEVQGGAPQEPRWTGEGGRSLLHVCPDTPVVPVRVALDPTQAIREAELRLESQPNPAWSHRRDPDPQSGADWQPENVRASFYKLTGQWANGRYRPLVEWVAVNPPGPARRVLRAVEGT